MRHYEHDCDHDTFIASIVRNGKWVDLYVHQSQSKNTFIARFSSEGPDYSSACESYIHDLPLEHPVRIAERFWKAV